jgi:hypothetical protein
MQLCLNKDKYLPVDELVLFCMRGLFISQRLLLVDLVSFFTTPKIVLICKVVVVAFLSTYS